MGVAVHPLGNWDQKTKRYLVGFFCFIYTHSFTDRMAKNGSSDNASSLKVDETGTPLQQGTKKGW